MVGFWLVGYLLVVLLELLVAGFLVAAIAHCPQRMDLVRELASMLNCFLPIHARC
jgi:hypothetical protein